jgi:hypothetical protein
MLKLDLIPNAYHSLYHAIEHMGQAEEDLQSEAEFDHHDHAIVWRHEDGGTSFLIGNLFTKSPPLYNYKFAILHLAQALEIIIKGYLHEEVPGIIFRSAKSRMTISLHESVRLLVEKEPGVLDESQRALILQTKDIRNTIEHSQFNFSVENIRGIAIDILSICNYLTYRLFDVRLVDEINWDPWTGDFDPVAGVAQRLLSQATERGFASHHTSVEIWKKRNPQDTLYLCLACGAFGASTREGNCIVCGEPTDEQVGKMIAELDELLERIDADR